MRPPIFVRALTDAERTRFEAGLRASEAFVVRRCQIVLGSVRGERVPRLAQAVGCDPRTVRAIVQGFNARGVAILTRGSTRPHQPAHVAWTPQAVAEWPALLPRSPRDFGPPTSVWTLGLVAVVSCQQGLSTRVVSDEAVRKLLRQAATAPGHPLEARQTLDHQPRPGIPPNKQRRDRLIALAQRHPTWAWGFRDEVWGERGSRLAQPALHTGTVADEPPLHLVEQAVAPDDPDPKALACYGALLRQADQPDQADCLWLRFVDGRPVSAVTMAFQQGCCTPLARQGVPVWALIGDTASWHVSRAVRTGIRAHNQTAKQHGHGVRLLVCHLPIKRPWLNPRDPKWVHGKRAIVEPARLLSAHEVAERVCRSFDCPHEDHLIQEKAR